MRFVPVLISASLLVSSVVAALLHDRSSHFHDLAKSTKGVSSSVASTNSNIAGAYVNDTAFFNSVTGSFRVPDLSGQRNTSVAIYVAIDGKGSCNPFAAGVRIRVDPNGQAIYGAFYTADGMQFHGDMTIHPGHTIHARVTTGSDGSSGNVYVCDGTSINTAGWYIFNPAQDTPPPNFGTVTFTTVNASASDGRSYGPLHTTIAGELEWDNNVLTSVLVNDDSIIISHHL